MGYKVIKHEGPETLTSLDFQTSNTPAIVISLFVLSPPAKNDKTHFKNICPTSAATSHVDQYNSCENLLLMILNYLV